jgi:hypothetical protein
MKCDQVRKPQNGTTHNASECGNDLVYEADNNMFSVCGEYDNLEHMQRDRGLG